MTFELITDRANATSDFNNEDRFIKVGGTLANVEIKANRNMERARVDLHIQPVTEVVRAGEKQDAPESFKNGIHVSFDYGQWDAVNKKAKGPRRDDVWFEAILPAFEEAGYDRENLGNDLLGRIGTDVTFVEREIERTNKDGDGYEVVARDEDRNVLPPINADDEGVTFDAEAKRWSDNAVFNKVPATYTSLLPVVGDGSVVAGPAAQGADAGERAAALLAASGDDYEAFQKAALDDAAINADSALRNAIIVGDYKG